jgi:hypothetical protein
MGEVQNEPSIIVGQPKECPHLRHSRWRFPIQELLHFVGVHRDCFRRNHVTQEWDFHDSELTFAELEVQLMLSQTVKYISEVIFMVFHTLQIYQNVINEHDDELVQLQHEN